MDRCHSEAEVVLSTAIVVHERIVRKMNSSTWWSDFIPYGLCEFAVLRTSHQSILFIPCSPIGTLIGDTATVAGIPTGWCHPLLRHSDASHRHGCPFWHRREQGSSHPSPHQEHGGPQDPAVHQLVGSGVRAEGVANGVPGGTGHTPSRKRWLRGIPNANAVLTSLSISTIIFTYSQPCASRGSAVSLAEWRVGKYLQDFPRH